MNNSRKQTNQTAITIELLAKIKDQYRLRWHGTHGVIHWSRVYENGIKLAEQDGVNTEVLQFFSIFHDSRRRNESWDRGHGGRGAQLAMKMRTDIPLNDDDFSLLITACSLHTSARTHDDITIQACFDSDRLDLGRVGTMPKAKYLCTPMAKMLDTIDWGYNRSLVHELPDKPFDLSGYNDRVSMAGGI
jgi:uncharacterized protein